MFRRFLILLILCLIGLAGCIPRVIAGPFVTHIAYDGEGNLLVTSNTVVYNDFSGVISNSENPQTIVIKTPNK